MKHTFEALYVGISYLQREPVNAISIVNRLANYYSSTLTPMDQVLFDSLSFGEASLMRNTSRGLFARTYRKLGEH